MNPITHDSESFAFQISVIKNILPKSEVSTMNFDIETLVGTWFECTLPITLLNDLETNYNITQSFELAYGFNTNQINVFFNSDNRTLYGMIENATVIRFDFTFSDDQ